MGTKLGLRPYALTMAVFGGTAEYLALLAKARGHAEWFNWYVTGCGCSYTGA